ncbi:MAG: D-aminoacylase [Candidatus Bathyarchaeia archaeon]
MYDLVVKGGTIVDGSGNPWFKGDIGIAEGKIRKIGRIAPESGGKTINAEGLSVSPGFIDIHNHSDLVLTLENHGEILEPFLRQGITTVVVGNCGMSAAPVTEASLELQKGYLSLITAGQPTWSWRSMKDYLTLLEAQGVLFNVACLVGQGTIRLAVMGARDTRPTSKEMEEMKALLRRCLEEGAYGMSTGLIYPPGMWSATDELAELAKVLAEYHAVFTSHVRGSSETGLDSERELISIAKASGVRVQHSHHEAFGRKFWSNIKATVRMDEDAREKGLDVAFDVIPYTAANTYLTAIFPPWTMEGGFNALIQRLKDPKVRARIKREVETLIPTWPPWKKGGWPHNLVEATGWKNIEVISIPSGRKKTWIGKSLAELGRRMGKHPFDVAADLVIEEGGGVMALYWGVSGDRKADEGVRYLLSHRLASIGPDAILTGTGLPHPAAYGAFPKVIGRYCRDLKLFPLEEAVRKMTSLPAQRIGIRDRGLIALGMAADLVLFDYRKIIDQATYEKPFKPPLGIKYVIINGQVALFDGSVERGLKPGKILIRDLN